MPGERPTNPTQRDVIEAMIAAREEDTFVAIPARVQSYDAQTQTADLVPMVKAPAAQPDGSYVHEELPVLPCVPVVFPRTGAWAVTFALEPGDSVQVLVNTLDAVPWRMSDGSAPRAPADLGRQHLAHAVCVPGIFPRSKALTRAAAATGSGGALLGSDAALVIGSDAGAARVTFRPNGALEIAQGDTMVVRIDPDGTVHLGGAAGDLVALAALVNDRLTRLQTAFDTHVHATAASVGTPSPPTPVPGAIPVGTLPSVAATKTRAT